MLRMHDAASSGIKTRLDVCVDADRYPQSGGKKFMEIRYITKRLWDSEYEWILSVHRSLEVDERAGHSYRHLELNHHPDIDPSPQTLWMRIVSANLRMSSLETELATRVANNLPCGSGLRLQLDGEWVAYSCDTGDEIDVLELSAAPMATHANPDSITDHIITDPNFDLNAMD